MKSPACRRTVVLSSRRGARDGGDRAVRHGNRRRRPGRPRCRVSPGEARPRVRHPGRGRASRRLLAQALGLAPTVHPGPLRRSAGLGVPSSVLVVPHEGRPGRLLCGLRCALRAPRPNRRTRGPALERRTEPSLWCPATSGSRPRTWSWRPGRTRAPGSLPSRARWIRASCSCTPVSTGGLRSSRRATLSWSAPGTRERRSRSKHPTSTVCCSREGTLARSLRAPVAGRIGCSPRRSGSSSRAC